MERNDAVDWFADKMKKKLDAKSHKQSWQSLSSKTLLERIRKELRELEYAIENKYTPEDIIDECVDIANYAMFLAHNIDSPHRRAMRKE